MRVPARLIRTLQVLVLVVVVGTGVIKLRRILAIDDCLDHGHNWDRRRDVCSEARPSGHRAASTVARQWLDALATDRTDELEALTALPYVQGGPAMKRCAGAASTSANRLAMFRCLNEDKIFLQELRYAAPLALTNRAISDLAQARRSSIERPCPMLVDGHINGDGVTFAMSLCLSESEHGPRVSQFVLHADFPE